MAVDKCTKEEVAAMGADPVKVAQAMTSVVEAHVVLTEFYKEVVAFYRIVDEQLADAHGPVRFDAHMENYIARYPGDKLKASDDWLPKWMGRFYCETSTETEEEGKAGGGAAETEESADLNVAFVYVVAYAPDGEAPGFKDPECWFGVAHPGTESRFKDSWDAGRYGVWHRLESPELPLNRWVKGEFPEMVNKFGKGGFWHVWRKPLADLLDENSIRTLVTDPLRAKYVEVFGGQREQE
jgi:hypothetical protein